MSSSNRRAVDCDGLVVYQDRDVGPLRLPLENPQQFIDDFNGCYERIGLMVKVQKKSPVVSGDSTGDGWSVDSVGSVFELDLSNLSGGA